MMDCPACNSRNLHREEVDIGVGTLHGPWRCLDCGWTEPTRTELDPDHYGEEEPW